MIRTTLAAGILAAVIAGPASGCVLPLEPMPFDLWKYGKHPRILIREGQCVIDPGFWTYTPPPRAPHAGDVFIAV